jgi:toxin-antitoxin system PIN domain toxin
MTLFFPDLNVWLALSDAGHSHSRETWNWIELLSPEARLIFSRYTQIGLLRLLTNSAVMGPQTLTLRKAWEVYQAWLADPRVEFYPEPRGLDDAFRQATAPLASRADSKWVGDCYLLAYARQTAAVLVTFDRALLNFARTQGFAAVRPAGQEPISR